MNQAEALEYVTRLGTVAPERNFYRATVTAPSGKVLSALGGTPQDALGTLGMSVYVLEASTDPQAPPGPHKRFVGGVWEDCGCERAGDHGA